MLDRERYLSELAARRRKSRAHTRHQLIGLLIAETLADRSHKSLYIKMAKEGNPDVLLALAKDVAERPGIDNRGAYFMAAAHESGFIAFTDPTNDDRSNLPTRVA